MRLRWYAYVRFTYTRTRIAIKKADNFSFEHQNTMILRALSEEDREKYLNYKSKIEELENEKLNILKLRKIENNSFINYIYRYNIVKIHNNNIKLKRVLII